MRLYEYQSHSLDKLMIGAVSFVMAATLQQGPFLEAAAVLQD